MRIAIVGFGGVGRRFAQLLGGPYGRVLRARGVEPSLMGVWTRRGGGAFDPAGLRVAACLRAAERGRLAELHVGAMPRDAAEFVRRVPADVLVELTPLEPRSGEPAISYVRAALRRGLHVVTANKGPVAHAGEALRRLARRQGRAFLHEGAVMDGTPVFNLVERCLPGARVVGFRGVLNATTTRILAAIEAGESYDSALAAARAAGVAEADPRHDVDGWDAAVKACVLANALMGAGSRPRDVKRRGIRRLDPGALRRARRQGCCHRLVARARRVAAGVRIGVAPERLDAGDVLASAGADGVLVLETDLMGEIAVWEGRAGLDQTAYAILSDLVRLASRG